MDDTNAAPVPTPPTKTSPAPTPPPVAVASPDTGEPNIPVVPIAKVEDLSGAPATTNASPPSNVIGPIPPSKDNADGHGGF
jgi:hypothetical protein